MANDPAWQQRRRELADRERIFQVLHPELEREFPPLASLAAFAIRMTASRRLRSAGSLARSG